jgi:hypothetical protein
MIGGGVPRYQIVRKLICFGANSVNVFLKAPNVVLQNKSRRTMLLILLGSIVSPIAPIWECKLYQDCLW